MVVGMIEIGYDEKNAGQLLAILITMRMRRYNVGPITQWSTSQSSQEATVCHCQASACIALLQGLPWSQHWWKTQKLAKNYV
jgi:hypothetical protein